MGNRPSASSIVYPMSYCAVCLNSGVNCADLDAITQCDSILLAIEDPAILATTDSTNSKKMLVAKSVSSTGPIYVTTTYSSIRTENNQIADEIFDNPLFGDVDDETHQETQKDIETHNKTVIQDKTTSATVSITNNKRQPSSHSVMNNPNTGASVRHSRHNLSSVSLSSQASEPDFGGSRDWTDARSENSVPVRNSSVCEREDVEDEITRLRSENSDYRRQRNNDRQGRMSHESETNTRPPQFPLGRDDE